MRCAINNRQHESMDWDNSYQLESTNFYETMMEEKYARKEETNEPITYLYNTDEETVLSSDDATSQ